MVREQGATQDEAAKAVGCHQSTGVTRAREVRRHPPPGTKAAGSGPLSRWRSVRSAKADPLKLLARMNVVREDRDQVVGSNVQVIIGIAPPGTPQNPIVSRD
jgi:hypothetical protein